MGTGNKPGWLRWTNISTKIEGILCAAMSKFMNLELEDGEYLDTASFQEDNLREIVKRHG